MSEEEGDVRLAAATVEDTETGDLIGADVWADDLLITPAEEELSFQTFRDYILFIESSLSVELVYTESEI